MNTSIPVFEKMPKWKVWFYATRPRTLPICLGSVFVGSFLVPVPFQDMHWWILFWSSLCALCIQIGTNLFNDAMDFIYGEKIETRLGPIRPTLQGTLSARETGIAAMLFFVSSLLFSIPLVLKGGLPVLIIVLLSVASGILYSWGHYSISRLGLSEIFLLFFFGWGIVLTNGYLQTGIWLTDGWIAGIQMGFLPAAVIAIDNLRDIHVDAQINKKTLAVRFGKTFGRCEVTLLLVVPYLLTLTRINSIGFLFACLPFLAFPIAKHLIQSIWKLEPSREYNKLLALCALHTLIFGILTITGYRIYQCI